MEKIILSTDRLVIRTWKQGDAPLMAAISSDVVVMRHFPSTQDLSTTEGLISRSQQQHKQFGYALYAIEKKDTQEFIGFAGLNHPPFDIPHFSPQGLPIVEIGWRLSQKYWGKGYATEAAQAILKWAFTVLNLKEIISFTVPANTPSRRVMEKIGLHHDELDDFNHPKLPENSPFSHHVLYRYSTGIFKIIPPRKRQDVAPA